MKADQQENLIRNYLFGELPEAEQTAFEQKLLADREQFDQVWAIENRLIDSYVRGEMSRSDCERFEGRYLASALHRERVAIAELFLKDLEEKAGETIDGGEASSGVPWWSRLWDSLRQPRLALGAAMAMLLLLAGGAVWLYIERIRLTERIAKMGHEAQAERSSHLRREQALEKESDSQRQQNEQLNAELERLRHRQQPQQAAEAPAFLSFLLTPAPLRGQNAPPPPQIPLVASPVRLLMELNAGNYPSYQLRLQTVEGREILMRQSSNVAFTKDRAFAAMTVPAGKLVKGDYILVLSGRTAKGAVEEIDQYFFRVR